MQLEFLNQNNVNIEVGPDANSQGVTFALSGASSFGGTISLASGSTMALQPSGLYNTQETYLVLGL